MNKSKRKGSLFERQVADYIAQTVPGVDRRVLRGNRDQGDIGGLPQWTLELKATREIDLAGAIDKARVEAKNAGTPYYAAIVKRRGKGVAAAYAVMTVEQWLALAASEL